MTLASRLRDVRAKIQSARRTVGSKARSHPRESSTAWLSAETPGTAAVEPVRLEVVHNSLLDAQTERELAFEPRRARRGAPHPGPQGRSGAGTGRGDPGPVTPFDLGTLAEHLARPAEPPARRRARPSSASMLLTAKRKAGKTTLDAQPGRSLISRATTSSADFPVRPLLDRAAFLNYEVSGARSPGGRARRRPRRPARPRQPPRPAQPVLTEPTDCARLAAAVGSHDVETSSRTRSAGHTAAVPERCRRGRRVARPT